MESGFLKKIILINSIEEKSSTQMLTSKEAEILMKYYAKEIEHLDKKNKKHELSIYMNKMQKFVSKHCPSKINKKEETNELSKCYAKMKDYENILQKDIELQRKKLNGKINLTFKKKKTK